MGAGRTIGLRPRSLRAEGPDRKSSARSSRDFGGDAIVGFIETVGGGVIVGKGAAGGGVPPPGIAGCGSDIGGG